MSLFKKTIAAISMTLIRDHAGLSEIQLGTANRANDFLSFQIQKMPDLLHFPMKTLTVLFSVWVALGTGRLFHQLPYHHRSRILNRWRFARLGACNDFVRFYEALTIFSWASEEQSTFAVLEQSNANI